ncbi:leucine-rich repeat-containing protein 49 isoform X7 [Osmia bicornis bicornis]|uniref:leucine-rich repeat-containing protein 49 isoform X7 n=1 Tax=Osmia bicornis bicornis TaxID=1437191 RepID=UPI001EAF6EAD|nr:leucine-rich repeat-containing protein 49 isoform X7 [Osmia bicornis bicornis]
MEVKISPIRAKMRKNERKLVFSQLWTLVNSTIDKVSNALTSISRNEYNLLSKRPVLIILSSDRATRPKTVAFDINIINGRSTKSHTNNQEDHFLAIAPALPILPGAPVPPKLSKRCYNSFSLADSPFNIEHDKVEGSNAVTLQWTSEGNNIVATRIAAEKEKSPDRICLDRRGLATFPNIVGEPRLRLLSLQHNLLTKIENSNFSQLTKLVFLDLYDNQIERICNFELLENLRVLLIGKNRIKKIEGLKSLSKLEVLDLHGNQIVQISDLNNLVSLKVLNIAGNNIKVIGYNDFQGLISLKELNLRRNKIKKLLGFNETPQLQKLYLSNNDIHKIEDMGSLAKALQLREIAIDGNPVTLTGDYVSFLVSYLPHLQRLSAMPITEQIRRAATAWRTTKEQSSIVNNLLNSKFDEKVVISNEGLTKGRTGNDTNSTSSSDSEIIESHENLKSCLKPHIQSSSNYVSQDDSDKFLANKIDFMNVLSSASEAAADVNESKSCTLFKSSELSINEKQVLRFHNQHIMSDCQSKSSIGSSGYCSLSSKTNSMDSCKSVLSDSSTSSVAKSVLQKSKTLEKDKNRVKSAQLKKVVYYKSNRAATARAKYRAISPPNPIPVQNPSKEREQGGDYLIEIVGRCLNIYGQGALRFIDRPWDPSKAEDVNVIKFNYVQFNDVAKVLCKVKNRFPNIEHFMFKETNITYLGQLNALAEAQGLTSIHLETGNPIISKDWKVYAIFRLAHWGLKVINGKEITNEEIDFANKEYAGFVDIVMCSLPESLLQPLLQRLHLEKIQKQNGEQITAKQFLLNSDPALRSVVAKEALQWRKGNITQEDLIWRHKGKIHLLNLINLTVDAIQKLQLLDNIWPSILYEIIHTTLSDFSDIDTYMKRCCKTLEGDK